MDLVEESGQLLVSEWAAVLRRDQREDPRAAVRGGRRRPGTGRTGPRSVDAAALAVHAAAARYAPSPTIAESSNSSERSLFDTTDIGGDDW